MLSKKYLEIMKTHGLNGLKQGLNSGELIFDSENKENNKNAAKSNLFKKKASGIVLSTRLTGTEKREGIVLVIL